MAISITWHGHANVQIASNDCNILIDPFFSGNPSTTTSWKNIVPPDVVLVTHAHGDHIGDAIAICQRTKAMLGAVVGIAEILQGNGIAAEQILNGIGFNIGGTVTFKGAAITMTEAFHTSEAGCPTGFIITMPCGYTLYHAGDTGLFSNMQTWGELYPIDLAFLPIGGVFTMDARHAAHAARMLKAKAVLPIHWGSFAALAQETQEFKTHLASIAPGCQCLDAQPGEKVNL